MQGVACSSSHKHELRHHHTERRSRATSLLIDAKMLSFIRATLLAALACQLALATATPNPTPRHNTAHSKLESPNVSNSRPSDNARHYRLAVGALSLFFPWLAPAS